MIRRIGLALGMGICLLSPIAGAVADSPVGSLASVDWEAGFLGRTLGGSACWLRDGTGNLRLEILIGDAESELEGLADPMAALLDWRGRGWTVVLDPSGRGTFNPWLEPWQSIAPSIGRWLQAVIDLLPGEPPAGPVQNRRHPGPRFLVAESTADNALRRQVALPQADAPTVIGSAFRSDMVARGSGRGAWTETLTLVCGDVRSWSAGDGHLEIRSSRRPGRLTLGRHSLRHVRYLDPEFFAPLWPLRDVLEIQP